jgi:hypothetical protein
MASLSRARDFLDRNGRLLERRLFAFHFEGGEASAVTSALTAYQNADGGFGWGLEPDKRTPASQPVDMQFAFETLAEIGALGGPMTVRACDWLEHAATEEGGVPFSLTSANDWPHMPWWTVEAPPLADINPTAAILACLLQAGVTHPWAERATAFCWRQAETSETTKFHDLTPMIAFLEAVQDRPRAERALQRLAERIVGRGLVEMAPDAAGYVKKPLDWAPSPGSFCRRLFDGVAIDQHLSALAARQQEDGGWPISWDPLSPGVELEWRGVMTLRALLTLRAYGAALEG